MPLSVRRPGVAGQFYPATEAVLRAAVDGFVASGRGWPMPAKAVIAPHAGYPFSGPVAGTAFSALRRHETIVRRVVLVGPAHRFPVPGVAFPAADSLETPLGAVTVDRAALSLLDGLPGVGLLDEAFDGEHALEVLLPFLRVQFPQAAVVPLLAGGASTALMRAVLDRLWGGPETLIVVSSDLSHFHGYDEARRRDAGTAGLIETLSPEDLNGRQACGHRAINGLLACARARDLRATALDLRSSGDTAGPRDRVVGYGAFAFEEAEGACLPEDLRRYLLDAVARALRGVVDGHGAASETEAADLPQALRARRNTFVTLELDGSLRGCVGSPTPQRGLHDDVMRNAVKAATADPRFNALTADELPHVSASISILSTPRPIACADETALLAELRPGIDGVILEDGGRRALFLPKVWSLIPDPRQFLRHLKAKAGLRDDAWSPDTRAWRFTAESF
jgi:AmmeMemoRadiSam system protein B/AmmeMemoRadiSam system protein A